MRRLHDTWAKLLVVAAIATFIGALVLPFFRLIPDVGDGFLREILEVVFGERFDPKAYSVLTGIFSLYVEGGWENWIVATVLLLFSVIFPTVKLSFLCLIVWWPKVKERIGDVTTWLSILGPWSMADVFAVSVFVIAFKKFPGGTRIGVCAGYYLFVFAVILTTALAVLLKRSILKSAPSALQ